MRRRVRAGAAIMLPAMLAAGAAWAQTSGESTSGGSSAGTSAGKAATPYLQEVQSRGQPEFLRGIAEKYGSSGAGMSADGLNAGTFVGGLAGVPAADRYAPFTYAGDGVMTGISPPLPVDEE